MEIVVLDGYCLNPGDLSWDLFKELGKFTCYDRTAPEEVLKRAKDAAIILTNKTILTAETINALPKLRYIGVLATGTNVVDIDAAHQNNVIVTNIPAYSTHSVAQMVFAHILNITNRVGLHADLVAKGAWSNCLDFSFSKTPQIELFNKTIGIIGLGHTGMATANIALGMGMKVIAFTSKAQQQLPQGILAVDMDTLFSQADIVSLHCPLTPQTKGLVDKKRLSQMKKHAILINTGRGPLIIDQDVADALNSRSIYAAGIDVLTTEPPKSDNPLLSASHCFITPHIAWATYEARKRLMGIAFDNIKAFQNGTPIHTVY